MVPVHFLKQLSLALISLGHNIYPPIQIQLITHFTGEHEACTHPAHQVTNAKAGECHSIVVPNILRHCEVLVDDKETHCPQHGKEESQIQQPKACIHTKVVVGFPGEVKQ